jgi:spore coat polysaccharide biosynthesis protein SpsF
MSNGISPIWAIVPGRMESERMPGKTMATLAGKPSLQHILERLGRVDALDGIVVATTTRDEDDAIAACGDAVGVPVHRGSAEDVLARTLGAARQVGAESIVTVTGDCPLTDPAIVERTVRAYVDAQPDYASNRLHGYKYPVGMDVEVFPTRLLAELDRVATAPRDREHVTLYFYENPEQFNLLGIEPDDRHRRPELRLTLDTREDYATISALYDALYEGDPYFGLDAALDHLERHPELKQLNENVAQVVP